MSSTHVSFFFSLCFSFLLTPAQITAVFTRALRDLPSRLRMRPHSGRQKNSPKSYRASCLLMQRPPSVAILFLCACRHMAHRQSSFFQSFLEENLKFQPPIHLPQSHFISAWFVLLLQSVTELHAQLCRSKSSSALAIFFSEANKYTKADTVLPASAKSPQLCAEPLLFLGGTLMLEAALCGHFMAGIEQ